MNRQVIDFQHKYQEYKLEDNILNIGIGQVDFHIQKYSIVSLVNILLQQLRLIRELNCKTQIYILVSKKGTQISNRQLY